MYVGDGPELHDRTIACASGAIREPWIYSRPRVASYLTNGEFGLTRSSEFLGELGEMHLDLWTI